jgi:hypothetical protein
MNVIPDEIKIQEILLSDSSFAVREGCFISYMKLENGSQNQVRNGGFDYIRQFTISRNGYTKLQWNLTPIAEKEITYPIDKNGKNNKLNIIIVSCDNTINEIKTKLHNATLSSAKKGGSFYATFNNGEGLIIVMPDEGLVAYFYLG